MMNLREINWNQFYYFYEVARSQSIKLAAASLKVSPPTVSEQIKKLEKKLGQELFSRDGRRIFLNAKGKELFAYTKEIFETGKRMVDQISGEDVGGYPVRVGVQDNLLDLASVEFISQYSDLYAPFGIVNTERERQSSRLIEQLVKGRYDWVITLESIQDNLLECQETGSFKIEFAISRDVYKRFKSDEDLFTAIPLALSSWDKTVNNLIFSHLIYHNIRPEEVIESDHREYSWRLAERGRAIIPVARKVTSEMLDDDNMSYFKVKEPISLKIYAIWKQSKSNMVSTKKLKELLYMGGKPISYDDPDFLIRLADVDEEKLR